MFRVAAASVDEYFAFDPAREVDLRRTDELIRAAAPTLTRWFVPGTADGKPGMAMTVIGYGTFEYAVRFVSTADLKTAGFAAMFADLERGLRSATVRARYGRGTTTVAVHGLPSPR
ncbi:hypothetical protein ACQPW1_25630 [Nocardia sp. CA-128927]|uniref:hypothetical protein n=1 Tax=Nocardia sp. CA-128927 TaxID=3239975 RepID=UPI003D951233